MLVCVFVRVCVCVCLRLNMVHRETDGNCCWLEVAATSPLSLLMKDEEGGKDAGGMDLRFWELHRLGPYLVVQSQNVLINKWTLH